MTGHVGVTDLPPVPLHGPMTCDRCGVADVGVGHDSASGINLHEPATCPIMVADMPSASSQAHDPGTCPCCRIHIVETEIMRDAVIGARSRADAARGRLKSEIVARLDAEERAAALVVALRRCCRVIEDCADLIGDECPGISTWADGLGAEVDTALADAARQIDLDTEAAS